MPGTPRPDGRYDLTAAASSEGIPETPEGLGLGAVDPPAESSSAPPVVSADGIAADASGRLSYQGLPVAMASDGTPRVHVSAGAMTIDTLKSLGVDLEYERLLHASRVQMGAA
ncbi:MAG: hypothetical protein ACLGI5_20805 [Thermoleophilia bacterium]